MRGWRPYPTSDKIALGHVVRSSRGGSEEVGRHKTTGGKGRKAKNFVDEVSGDEVQIMAKTP